jgi:alditol oxidase
MAPAVLYQRYQKLPDFLALAKQYDPQQKFGNAYLDLNLYNA